MALFGYVHSPRLKVDIVQRVNVPERELKNSVKEKRSKIK